MPFRRSHGTSSKFGQIRRGDEDFFLPLTPLIDVVFLLLIFFMVSTAFVDFSRVMEIDLPESKSGESFEEIKNIIIELSVNKEIRVNGEDVALEDLVEKLKTFSRGGRAGKPALIRADKKLPYGDVVEIMSICRDAKIDEIGVVVK